MSKDNLRVSLLLEWFVSNFIPVITQFRSLIVFTVVTTYLERCAAGQMQLGPQHTQEPYRGPPKRR